MPNRFELQDKGQGFRKNPLTGHSIGPGTSHKGISRAIRDHKHSEAETRNANTAPDRKRSFWRERGFTRQSQAANLVAGTVAEVNEQARIHKQRSADWSLLPEEMSGALLTGTVGHGKSSGPL
jgi:hypothetical protein